VLAVPAVPAVPAVRFIFRRHFNDTVGMNIEKILPNPRSTRTWGWICWIRSLSGVAETWWDAGGILHARTPAHSPPDVKIGRSTPRSLYTLLHLCMSLFCLLRVWLFAMGEYKLDLTAESPLGGKFCSKLRAPHRGTSLGPFVRGVGLKTCCFRFGVVKITLGVPALTTVCSRLF
jgi:hypothetical protein